MLQVFGVTLPFFLLIAAGYGSARAGALPLASIPGINVFVLYYALPCMLFRFGAQAPAASLLDAGVALVWGMSAMLVVALAIVLARRRSGWNDAAFGALVAAFPNTGFMGVPLLIAILGAQAASPMMFALAFDMIVTSSLCIALSRLDGAGEHGVARSLARTLRGVVQNPLPWAIAAGALASATGARLPLPIERTVGMLADAASPVALFTIGAVLARAAMLARESAAGAVVAAAAVPGVPAGGREPSGPSDVWMVVLIKLVVHPALVLGLCAAMSAMGRPLPSIVVQTLVLMAALPSASNVSMLAERYGADSGRIARIILWTTVAAFLLFPAAASWLR